MFIGSRLDRSSGGRLGGDTSLEAVAPESRHGVRADLNEADPPFNSLVLWEEVGCYLPLLIACDVNENAEFSPFCD